MRTQQDSIGVANAAMDWRRLKNGIALGLGLALGSSLSWCWAEEPGITAKTISLGSTLPLEGDFKTYGLAIKKGLEMALAGQTVQKRDIELLVVNDFYSPSKTVEAVKQIIEQGIFVMVGSFGSPTTRVALPILAEKKVPALGFTTGAAFTTPGDILNFRASYAHEVAAATEAVLAAGVKPTEVCAYAQNDAYGMSGIKGFRAALAKQPGAEPIVAKLDQILNMTGDSPERNDIGPVGVYERDTSNARRGYQSLKKWEETSGVRCRFVATTAVYDSATAFMGYARYKGENWVFSSPSPATGNRLKAMLKESGISDRVLVTQIVPPADSPLPIVVEARAALLKDMEDYALEGYIVGKLFLAIARTIEGPLTRENFLKAARRQPYDIGGIKVDFTTDNQGSDFVFLTYLKGDKYEAATPRQIEALFKQ